MPMRRLTNIYVLSCVCLLCFFYIIHLFKKYANRNLLPRGFDLSGRQLKNALDCKNPPLILDVCVPLIFFCNDTHGPRPLTEPTVPGGKIGFVCIFQGSGVRVGDFDSQRMRGSAKPLAVCLVHWTDGTAIFFGNNLPANRS